MAAKKILLLTAVATLISVPALAQVQTTETDPRFMPRVYGSTAITGADYGQGATTTYQNAPVDTVRIEAPMTQSVQPIISAPITYSDSGVIKAQHFKQGDLTAAEYEALLAEADRVRAYQITNESYSSSSYNAPSYEIELFETATAPAQGDIVYAETKPITSFDNSYAAASHTVVKGDTLYNISRRYAVSVSDLKSVNGLSDNIISLGQLLTVPGAANTMNQNSYTAPAATTWSDSSATLFTAVEPAKTVASDVYAVLPKDTLYSISRRACVKVGDVIAINGISDPSSLQPGQRLTMPTGHCLN
ncbi:lytic transglycosylase [Hellea balneolensis]|uniref:lytic transglycosylase n=1 Tax=Hellea balneolensis TaxID=287478 RepID=UPI0004221458|nr:LysM peptidoglycan-binding domain-containing protein [Hellea balneolensis]